MIVVNRGQIWWLYWPIKFKSWKVQKAVLSSATLRGINLEMRPTCRINFLTLRPLLIDIKIDRCVSGVRVCSRYLHEAHERVYQADCLLGPTGKAIYNGLSESKGCASLADKQTNKQTNKQKDKQANKQNVLPYSTHKRTESISVPSNSRTDLPLIRTFKWEREE